MNHNQQLDKIKTKLAEISKALAALEKHIKDFKRTLKKR